MIADNFRERLLNSTAGIALAVMICVGGPAAYAQDADTDDVTAAEDDDDERLVVTGSRIRRDAFSSSSPLQVIDSETISESGLIDVGDILRSTTVVQGAQLDLQTNTDFVTGAGPGGQAVALRGLDEERTLVLVNSRRLAPAGVEGAPSFPDISLIPSSMIERVEILLDGASSVYGSDAVAGVINLILRDEFEGISLNAFRSQPQESGGGASQQYNFLVGATGDRGSFLIGGEYVHQEELRGNERDWMAARNDTTGEMQFGPIDLVPGDNGGIRRILGTRHSPQSFIASPFGILVGRPGTQNPAFGIFEDFENWDGDTASLATQGRELNEDEVVLPEFQRFNLYLTAKHEVGDWLPGTEAFLEFFYSNRQTNNEDRYRVFDVQITPDNPYNIFTEFGGTANTTLRPQMPRRDIDRVELDQWRIISGLRGDFGFVGLGDWEYEVYAGYTRSHGFSEREGLREEAFLRSLDTVVDPDSGQIVCRDTLLNPTGPFASVETLEQCVPFNPFFPGLYMDNPRDLRFEDPRLEGYLFGVRQVTTFVEETIASGYVTGPLFNLPAGTVQAVIGAEWREDTIDTRSDDTAARGLISGFFKDLPTRGSVELWEIFGELSVPVIRGAFLADLLEIQLAGRFTNHEFYGSNETYSVRGTYMPVDWLTFRGTVGTSFRAPNLRELFLAGQSGFQNITDPCVVPNFAQIDTDGDGQNDTYDPGPNGENDTRSARIIANCQAVGIDPFSLGIGISPGSAEVFRAGNTDLDPETSFAYTAGVVFDLPPEWVDTLIEDLDVRVGFTYFDINIEGAVLIPGAQFLVDQCFNSETFPNSPFCTRQVRNPVSMFFSEIDATPFNIAEENSIGFDINLFVGKDFSVYDQDFRLEVDVVSTYTDENSLLVRLAGDTSFEDNAGDIGTPYWRATGNARLRYEDWTLFWRTRWIGAQRERDLGSLPGNCYIPGQLDARGCFSTPDVFYHDISLNWAYETWAVRFGVNNVFDTDPPQIDEDVAGNGSVGDRAVPVGIGYDLIGRRFFFDVSKTF